MKLLCVRALLHGAAVAASLPAAPADTRLALDSQTLAQGALIPAKGIRCLRAGPRRGRRVRFNFF